MHRVHSHICGSTMPSFVGSFCISGVPSGAPSWRIAVGLFICGILQSSARARKSPRTRGHGLALLLDLRLNMFDPQSWDLLPAPLACTPLRFLGRLCFWSLSRVFSPLRHRGSPRTRTSSRQVRPWPRLACISPPSLLPFLPSDMVKSLT